MTAPSSAHLLAVALLGAALLACNTRRAPENEPARMPLAGVYTVEATLGETAVPARLELADRADGYVGRLQIELGQPLYFALRSTTLAADSAQFATSAPATRLTLTVQNDTLAGMLVLTGSRMVRLGGTRVASDSVSPDLRTHLAVQPFAPDAILLDGRGEAFPAVAPDGESVYFSTYEADFARKVLVVSHRRNGAWSVAEALPFSGVYNDRSGALSSDGTRLIFASRRPRLGESGERSDYDLWAVDRNPDGGCGSPRPLAALNSKASEYQPSIAANGTLYFSSDRVGGEGGQDLYRAAWTGDAYAPPENLGPPGNSEESEMSGLIFPNEERLVFSSSAPREGRVGNDDLYVSVRKGGAWSEPPSQTAQP